MRRRTILPILALCAVVALAVLAASESGQRAHANITGVCCGADEITAPASVQNNALTDDNKVFAFDERQNVLLTQNLEVDDFYSVLNSVPSLQHPDNCTPRHTGDFDVSGNMIDGHIPAGMTVSSHYLHGEDDDAHSYDNDDSEVTLLPSTGDNEARVTVDEPILGIIVKDAGPLQASNFLGASGTLYTAKLTSQSNGLEWPSDDNNSPNRRDYFKVGCGHPRNVDVRFRVTHDPDQIRIITDEHPNCSGNSVKTNEDTTSVTFSLNCPLLSTADITCTVLSESNPGLGELNINSCRQAFYEPSPNQNGTGTVTYRATDHWGKTDDATVSVTVNAVNDTPSFTAGPPQKVLEDAGPQTVAPWATAISAGPKEAQTVNFLVSNDNNALFSAQPAVAPNGTLSYTPAANMNGSATVTVRIQDSGGGTSLSQDFIITVNPVNDVPIFTKGTDQKVLEDAGPQTVIGWATGISAGKPANEAGQLLDFNLISNDNNALFSTQPAVAPDGTLTYTPAANENGSATVTLRIHDNGGTTPGVDTSAAQDFIITVNPVNDIPSFTKGADQKVLEDAGPQTVAAWATGISAGKPLNEGGQLLDFNLISNDNNALFSTQPAVAPDGTLTYTPAANENGSAIVTLRIHDDGGTSPGVDTSPSQDFTITVNPVNDVPTFIKGADQKVLEDAGPQTVAGWATAISPGKPLNEAGQFVDFNLITNDNNALFSAQPAVAPDGTLTYTPAANMNGSAIVTLRIHDDGGTSPGVDTSAPQTFTIAVTLVNDVPTFIMGADQKALENSGAQTVPGWATAISPGKPLDEAGQTVNFIVSNNSNSLFSVQPAISVNGTLTYTPAVKAIGSATVTVQLHDNGGIDNGGVDTSPPQTFVITVNEDTSLLPNMQLQVWAGKANSGPLLCTRNDLVCTVPGGPGTPFTIGIITDSIPAAGYDGYYAVLKFTSGVFTPGVTLQQQPDTEENDWAPSNGCGIEGVSPTSYNIGCGTFATANHFTTGLLADVQFTCTGAGALIELVAGEGSVREHSAYRDNGLPNRTTWLRADGGDAIQIVCGAGAPGGPTPLEHYEQAIGGFGGKLTTGTGDPIEGSLVIASGALSSPRLITVDVFDINDVIHPPGGGSYLSRAFDFGPSGTTFATPATVTFTYTDAEVLGLTESALGVWLYDSTNQWTLATVTRDTEANTLTAQIPHFTLAVIRDLSSSDFDSDGCADSREIQTAAGSETSGGLRDLQDFWDFFDVWTHPAGMPLAWERTKTVSLSDITAISKRFATTGNLFSDPLALPTDDTSYHVAYDRRAPATGADPWDLGPPDGAIGLAEINLAAKQFAHSCA